LAGFWSKKSQKKLGSLAQLAKPEFSPSITFPKCVLGRIQAMVFSYIFYG
jgi:hypothetical protein